MLTSDCHLLNIYTRWGPGHAHRDAIGFLGMAFATSWNSAQNLKPCSSIFKKPRFLVSVQLIYIPHNVVFYPGESPDIYYIDE